MSICKFSNCYNSTSLNNYVWESYCYQHYNNNEQNRLKSLVCQKTPLSNPQEVERFSTWWNKNLATVVSYYDGYYRVFLLVLDSENNSVKVFPESSSCSYWGDFSAGRFNQWKSASAAQNEADCIQSELTERGKYYENPILLIHPRCDSYTGFNDLISSPYVKIDYSASRSEFKPLDIAWVEKSNMGYKYYHAGVYIGNGELIEYNNDEKFDNFLTNFMKGGITRKVSWSKFLEGQKGSIRRYHPIIPFKDYKEIIAQLVWAKDTGFWRESYNLANRNCQHFSNMAVLGINYSQEVEDKKGLIIAKHAAHIPVRAARTTAGTVATGIGIGLAPFTFGLSLIPAAVTGVSTVVGVVDYVEKIDNGDFKINNGKGSTIKLTNEISKSNGNFGRVNDFETEKYERRYLQEVPSYIPTDNCRIM